jgi:serine/threonine-protein kinase
MDLTPLPNPPDPLAGRALAGGLRVLSRLGETSEGPLYRAEYSEPGPPVGVLFLTPLRQPPEPRRLDWVHRAARIRHPNVARVYEVSETPDGIAYVVVEALSGDRLSEILAARGALHFQEAVDVCLQAAAGLSAAHEAGIIHGSVSPSTILLTHGETGRRPVKLIGFALVAPPAASSGYACPERCSGRPPDELSDIFALGAVLHHALTGAPPGGRSARRPIPKPVRGVIRKALAVSPARRFQTISEFADALAQAAATRRRTRRLRLRRTLVVRATAASVVVGAGLWMGWSDQRVVGGVAREELETGTRSVATAPADTVHLAPGRRQPGIAIRQTPRRPEPRPPAPPARPDSTTRRPAPSQPEPRLPAPPPRPTTASRVVLKQPEPPPPAPPPKTSVAPPAPAPVPATPQADTRVAPRQDTSAPVSHPPPSSRPPADSAPPVVLSPFRRAHPWAAMPGGRFYFRSSCSVALRATELLYFTSEAEARATGRARSPVPGCS